MSRKHFFIRNALYSFKPNSIRKKCIWYQPPSGRNQYRYFRYETIWYQPPSGRNQYRYFCYETNLGNQNIQNDIDGLYEVYDSVQMPSKEDLFEDGFGIGKMQAQKMIAKNRYLQDVYPDILQHNINLAKREFCSEDIKYHRQLLISYCSKPLLKFEHRLQLMKEISIPVTVKNFNKFKLLFDQKVRNFLECGLIDPNYDIPRRIFGQLEAPNSILDQLPSPDTYHNMKFSELSAQLQGIFVQWQLNLDVELFNALISKMSKRFFSMRSFTMQLQMLSLIRKYSLIDNSKIINNLTLLVGIPKFCEDLLLYSHPINGISCEKLILKLPLILLTPLKHVLKNEAMLNYIHATTECINPRVYRYAPLTILHGIESLIKLTSLADLRLTPRNVNLLFAINKCVEKMKSLEKDFGKLDSFPSVTFLLNSEYSSISLRSRKLAILSFLETFVFVPREESAYGLALMNLVEYPSLSCLKKNYSFLINEGFSKDLIRRSYHLLMFPPDMLKENYEKLPESEYAQEFMASNERDKLLQLLIYYTAKAHNKVGGSIA